MSAELISAKMIYAGNEVNAPGFES
jgi:hypothetical protein